jgi:hypothetical protein
MQLDTRLQKSTPPESSKKVEISVPRNEEGEIEIADGDIIASVDAKTNNTIHDHGISPEDADKAVDDIVIDLPESLKEAGKSVEIGDLDIIASADAETNNIIHDHSISSEDADKAVDNIEITVEDESGELAA